MSVEFEWSGVHFRAVVEVDFVPEDGLELLITKLYVIHDKTEINVDGFLEDSYMTEELHEAALESYNQETKYERSFP